MVSICLADLVTFDSGGGGGDCGGGVGGAEEREAKKAILEWIVKRSNNSCTHTHSHTYRHKHTHTEFRAQCDTEFDCLPNGVIQTTVV